MAERYALSSGMPGPAMVVLAEGQMFKRCLLTETYAKYKRGVHILASDLGTLVFNTHRLPISARLAGAGEAHGRDRRKN